MIFVDRRVGSHEYIPLLERLGFPVEQVTLPFADFAFEGRGEGDTSVEVGIELKKLPDFIASCRDSRLQGHQLPGLQRTYDVTWLIIEGEYSINAAGEIVTPNKHNRVKKDRAHGNMTGNELHKTVLSLTMLGGLHVWHTNHPWDSAHVVGSLYRWWTDKPLDRHESHLGIHQRATLTAVSDTRTALFAFPGLGLAGSAAAERHFGCLRRAVNAGVREWTTLSIKSKGGRVRILGRSVAERIERFLDGK